MATAAYNASRLAELGDLIDEYSGRARGKWTNQVEGRPKTDARLIGHDFDEHFADGDNSLHRQISLHSEHVAARRLPSAHPVATVDVERLRDHIFRVVRSKEYGRACEIIGPAHPAVGNG